ncbi:MAG: PHP domain-containing protein [Bacteroidota bacterium]
MLRWIPADLHIHTCLSPCGDILMSPRRVVEEACRKRLGLIAVTDHNSAGNTGAAMRAAEGTPLRVLPGLEICSAEEAHILALFGDLASALDMQGFVHLHLAGRNEPEKFGVQVLANERDEVERFEERLLIGATDIPLEALVEAVHRLEGLAVAAHVDRESYSVPSQLGFIPPGVPFDALEVSARTDDPTAAQRWGGDGRTAIIRSSDAHAPGEMGGNCSEFLMADPSLRELRTALRDPERRRTRRGGETPGGER